MQSAQTFLDSINQQLFTTGQPTQVFIILGSTASRPSELYSLSFPAIGDLLDHFDHLMYLCTAVEVNMHLATNRYHVEKSQHSASRVPVSSIV